MKQPTGFVALQAKHYALQMVVAALLVRTIESRQDIEREGKELLDLAVGSIAKFEIRGDASHEEAEGARAAMEAAAIETITAALQSARLRSKSRR